MIGERRVLEEDVVQELSNSLALALLAGPCPGEVLQSKYLMASPQMTLLDTQKIGPLSKGGSHTHINIEWVICPSKYTKLQIFQQNQCYARHINSAVFLLIKTWMFGIFG